MSWRRSFGLASSLAACALCACKQGTPTGTLVGNYEVRGVLVENTCGQAGLPTNNPLRFTVELREDQGVGYWVPTKMSRNTGSVNADGSFRFTLSATRAVTQTGQPANLQPNDFVTLTPDFDLKQTKTNCALTTSQTVSGKLLRRLAADGGVVGTANMADGGPSDDLTAEHLIAVNPTTGSDCNPVLAVYGGTFTALPCQARYVLSGTLVVDSTSSAQRTSPAAGKPAAAGSGAAAAGAPAP